MKVKHFEVDELRIKKTGKYVKVIELIQGRIITRNWATKYTGVDLERDILKLVAVECRSASGEIGIGFVKGFGLTKGAIAQSLTHDLKCIICTGKSDEDMTSAIRRVIKLGGGIVVVAGGMILADIALPLAGMLDKDHAKTAERRMLELYKVARELGCKHEDPFSALAFLSLPTLPELRLTEKGLVDVNQCKIVDLFE